MELHCLPAETPTTASSSSTDPLYDNYCPLYAHRGRDRHRERDRESRARCPAVTRLPVPCSPLPGLAPAVAEVPTLGGGGGPGAWPDHSYCSWGKGLGRQGWEAELGPGMNRARGGERGGEGGRREGVQDTEEEERVHQNQSPSPSPSQSEEHKSALSVYDNLRYAATPDSLLEVFSMETGFLEPSQEWMYQARAAEQIQVLMEDEGASRGNSSWSSCEIILAGCDGPKQDQDPDQEKDPEQEPEPDSGPCAFDQEDPMPHLQLPLSHLQTHLAASLPHQSQTGLQAQWLPAAAQHPEEPPRAPRVPPPVPLADPSASALRSVLTNLQHQIVRQREEYEARIISLEQRNEELQVEVVGLRANLAQQRHWYQVVQAKIAESERARAAADLRNAALQREMEQFFDTFGELNNEAKKTECIVRSF
ncbi:uncharacterized protein LOC144542413 [Centroberyx gerrardi]